jgi:hypothetical protein
MSAHPTSTAIRLGLGGSFRQLLIDESFVVAAWPLAELSSLSLARDITGNNNHGTYNGTGFTRGVTGDLPEGNLALTFDGNGYIEVPDDSGLGARTLNLSLADGDIDIVFLIKTSTNDATNRAIVQKMVTDATGNGWSASLVSGAIRFRLEVAGTQIFSFDRGSVADNAWHLVHCNYQTTLGTGEARIYIDGAQSGAAVTGVTTEPAVTGANLRIGCWNDGSGDFIGTLAFVMIGREGNGDLSTALQAARQWTDVTVDTTSRVPIECNYGIAGTNILDNVAREGSLTFALDNSILNSGAALGYYTPGHANCRSGFAIGIPVQWSVTFAGTTYYKFRGRITSVRPVPGIFDERLVLVSCADWMNVAAQSYVSAMPALINESSDEVIKRVLDQADGRSPVAVSISAGSSQFPFALDVSHGEQETLLTEFARTQASERGYLYIKGDTVQGGVLRSEGRGDRQMHNDLDVTLTAAMAMDGLQVEYGVSRIINIIRVVFTPRQVDSAATTVLYRLEASQETHLIQPGATLVLEGGYFDPNNQAERVGGTDMVEPVANTDYAFWSNSNGTGVNLTTNLEIYTANGEWLGGNSFRVEITNTGTASGYLRLNSSTAFQLRGKGIYHYRPIMVERRDRDSVRKHGPRTVQIDLPYESSLAQAEAVADFYINILNSEQPIPPEVTIWGNQSAALLTQALAREPGDKVGIVEAMTGVTTVDPNSDEDIGFFINHVRYIYSKGGIFRATWALAPSAPIGAWVWDESVWDESTAWGF